MDKVCWLRFFYRQFESAFYQDVTLCQPFILWRLRQDIVFSRGYPVECVVRSQCFQGRSLGLQPLFQPSRLVDHFTYTACVSRMYFHKIRFPAIPYGIVPACVFRISATCAGINVHATFQQSGIFCVYQLSVPFFQSLQSGPIPFTYFRCTLNCLLEGIVSRVLSSSIPHSG